MTMDYRVAIPSAFGFMRTIGRVPAMRSETSKRAAKRRLHDQRRRTTEAPIATIGMDGIAIRARSSRPFRARTAPALTCGVRHD
jgi:hypothetical protein